MKLVKSLLLGSAAGLVAVAGASAADLGVKKPTAVEYVKTCPTYGAGFFVVPGTTSCLKLIGRVRADYMVDAPARRAQNHNRFRVRGYVGFDHRTATEYGLLRTYMRAYFQHQNGGSNFGAGLNAGVATAVLEYAFIQFGGLTAGRVTPIFEHGWNQFYLFSGQGGFGYHSDISYVNSLGYTFNAGGGFSATIAIDDPRDRRISAAGAAMPDVVASLAYDQAWGSLKLSGALFQLRAANAAVDTTYGYAVEGAAKFNLPMLTKGSNIWVSGSYSKGSSSYVGFDALSGFGIGSFTAIGTNATDWFVPAGLTSLKLSTNFSVMGALQVYFTPTISASIGGTYASHNPFGANNTIKTASVIGQVAWTPVAGFLIGGELAYRKLSFDAGAALVPNGNGSAKKDDVVGRIRFQRDF